MPLGPGSRLDAYEIVAHLGKGGMGEVWLARDRKLNRQIALKVLPSDLTQDPSRVARFQQEARAASALNHPNVCTIHALGETTDGQQFIAMEFVDGETLRKRLARGAISLREVLDLGAQIASALSAAHAAGVVHRDVKPENVMLRRDGIVKVLDFGLAKLAPLGPERADAHTTHAVLQTDTGTVIGTVDYMSPEQARGQPVDARTDIWSLGVLLYEMVAGRRPFPGQSSIEVLARILEQEPPSLARFAPDTPLEFQRIVGKALRKDREERYQVLKDLLLDLQALRDELAASSISRVPSAQTNGLALKNGRRGVILIAAVLLVAAVIVGVWWIRRAPPAPARAASTPVDRPLIRVTFGEGLQTDPAFSPDGRAIAYASDRGGKFDIWIDSVSGGNPRQVTKSRAQNTQPDWSPDGRTIVFRSEGEGGGVFTMPAQGGPQRQLSSFGIHPQWLPDGSEILFRTGVGNTHRIYTVSPEGGDPPREVLAEFLRGGDWTWIAPHPDGRLSVLGIHPRFRFGFYTVSRDGKQVTSSKLAQDLPLQWTEQGTRLVRFQWDAAGTALYVEAVLNEVRNVWRIRVEPTTLAWLTAERLTTGPGPDVAATLSGDGKRLAFTIQRQSTRLWSLPFDAIAGRVVGKMVPLTPDDESITSSTLSRDGRRVAYSITRAGKSGSELWVMETEAGTRELFAANALSGAWTPDGTILAYVLSRPDVPPPGEWALAVRQIGGPERIVGGWSKESLLMPSDWTPDGRSLLGSYASPLYTRFKLALWRISKDGIVSDKRILIDDPTHFLFQASFSPDGKWVSFSANALDDASHATWVAPAVGAPASKWTPIAPGHEWVDKPRWAPDGRTLYFISKDGSSFFNLWGARFDPDRGMPVGDAFRITRFDSPGLVISPDLVASEIHIAQRRAVLTMATVTGNIWMLDNVDRDGIYVGQ